MDWMELARLLIELIRPLIWGISIFISVPSIVKLIEVWSEWRAKKKDEKDKDKNKGD